MINLISFGLMIVFFEKMKKIFVLVLVAISTLVFGESLPIAAAGAEWQDPTLEAWEKEFNQNCEEVKIIEKYWFSSVGASLKVAHLLYFGEEILSRIEVLQDSARALGIHNRADIQQIVKKKVDNLFRKAHWAFQMVEERLESLEKYNLRSEIERELYFYKGRLCALNGLEEAAEKYFLKALACYELIVADKNNNLAKIRVFEICDMLCTYAEKQHDYEAALDYLKKSQAVYATKDTEAKILRLTSIIEAEKK